MATAPHTPLPRWEEDPILAVEHLFMRFGGLIAVNDLSFKVGRGDITALIGPNGAGKTTVFNCITGFYKPSEGRLVLAHGRAPTDGELASVTLIGERALVGASSGVYLLERMPDHRVSGEAKVARTFQNIRLFTGMTVLENLMVAQHNALMAASGYSLKGLFGLPSWNTAQYEATENAKYWLDKVGLTDRADDPAGDLPYGAQRRLEIARAMCSGPILLCLDEPAAGLNPRESLELNELLRSIRAEHGTSILLIEHDMSVVMEISDHVIVLDYGTKISDGTPDAVKNDPRVIAAYLGVDEDAVEEVEAEIEAEVAGSTTEATS
ncbi:ABC transporter ATP-binding protein [Ancylobacter mangrovi]|uniref:ABC transporter ATP-binding protein n=1 Tax=Ancylobacter mangrovi TaxID=2972472 RepID=A0A9X2PC17_9HYPH|nr:ABC transporter ATP-binding protein [Ancylobacter mangrovi]MCS0496017.1 ABC transporter ATP-binding protein [Ancylobacter mangrovi]MCS0504565.1 ABC transporter ATP-binding protein [Ancylobacter mangrovi]